MGKTSPLLIMPFNQRIKICVAQTQDGISGEEPWVTALDTKNGLKTEVEPEVDLVKG